VLIGPLQDQKAPSHPSRFTSPAPLLFSLRTCRAPTVCNYAYVIILPFSFVRTLPKCPKSSPTLLPIGLVSSESRWALSPFRAEKRPADFSRAFPPRILCSDKSNSEGVFVLLTYSATQRSPHLTSIPIPPSSAPPALTWIWSSP